jgi:hypothetical protein
LITLQSSSQVEPKCNEQATVPVDKEQVLVAKKRDSLPQYDQNAHEGTNVDVKDEEVDGDGDASLPRLCSGGSHPKPQPKLSIREYYCH